MSKTKSKTRTYGNLKNPVNYMLVWAVEHRDELDAGDDPLHDRVFGNFRVLTWATPHCDKRGQTGIRVQIVESDMLVYDTGPDAAGLVYGSPMHDDDSDACLASCINLCCYDAQHDEHDNPVTPGWDAETLSDLAAIELEPEDWEPEDE